MLRKKKLTEVEGDGRAKTCFEYAQEDPGYGNTTEIERSRLYIYFFLVNRIPQTNSAKTYHQGRTKPPSEGGACHPDARGVQFGGYDGGNLT